ncbi:hypothetical protein EDB85DRAFT_2051810 [Lactarius pseudohatsudake]|nr:hypothetical protein EDB85DRAFT_2051810 [Lactarius pseudohatsudake]
MLSSGCCGSNAGEWFLNATVVLPSGEVIKMRRRSRKSSAGLDTMRLFVGAEGTLGIVTEVTVRLIPITVLTARFPDVRKASEAVIEILNTAVFTSRPECIELVDAAFIRVTMATENPAREYDIRRPPVLQAARRDARRARRGRGRGEADSEKHGGDKFWPAQSEEAAAIVPISKLPRLIYQLQKDIERSGIMCFVLDHAGDGG